MDLYKKALAKLQRLPKNGTVKEREWVQKYLGSNKPTKCIKGSEIIKIAKEISDEHSINQKEFVDLLNNLYKNATTFEEIDLGARLLQVNPKLKLQITAKNLDYWLNFTHGWAETDVLCQSNFSEDALLGDWKSWNRTLIGFSKDKNIHKRRASLVLLNKSLRDSDDSRLSDLAFQNVNLLKTEKDILITKAVSWVLRSLIKNHKGEVSKYLEENKETLPKIAYRESKNKLLTGAKSRRPGTS